MTLTKPQLRTLLGGKGMDGMKSNGDTGAVLRLMSLPDKPVPGFAIVTP